MRINNNIMAMNTHRSYSANYGSVSKSVSKLSSGYQINSAADDAAGLAISEKMRAQIRGLEMASKNSQDGISMVQTAEGALQTTHDILQRMREIAVQSASDTNETSIDRSALDSEFQQLINEINDTATKTRFNDQNLIDGTFAKETTATSSAADGVKSAWAAATVAAGTYDVKIEAKLTTAAVTGLAATTTGDTAFGAAITTALGIADLTATYAASTTDLTSASNGTWTFGFNSDTNMFTMTNSDTGEILSAAAESIAADGGESTLDFGKAGVVTLTNDNATTSVTIPQLQGAASSNMGSVTLSGGVTAAAAEYRMTATIGGDTINVEAGTDTLVFGNSNISVKLSGALTLDTATGDISAGTQTGSSTYPITMAISVSKNKGKDFVLQTGANQGDELAINIDRMDANTIGVGSASVSNRLNASAAVTQVNTAINLVSTQRSELGALQNRLEFKIQNLDVSAENLTSAESRIRDVDMAKEMTEFTKQNILAQASTAMLAQANSLPQGVLQLLG